MRLQAPGIRLLVAKPEDHHGTPGDLDRDFPCRAARHSRPDACWSVPGWRSASITFLSQRGHAGADLAKDYWREGPQGTLRTTFSDDSGMALGMACAWLLHIGMVFVEQYDPARAEGFSQLLSELAAGAD